jgi:thiamine-monophosphate kinase
MNEFAFIDQLRSASRKHSTRLISGIGDDAAVISERADRDLVVTTDLLIEEIDFHQNATPPRHLGHKALAVSLSDIAAMGARPFWSFLSIGMPQPTWDTSFKDEFINGFFELADKYRVTLAGGDVSEAKERIVIDSIVLGEVTRSGAIMRSGARAGDQIFVTGNLGGAAAGLKLIELGALIHQRSEVRNQRSEIKDQRAEIRDQESEVDEQDRGSSPTVREGFTSVPHAAAGGSPDEDAIQTLLLRQLQPQPRVGWGIVLGEEHLATAMIDISDGLSSDLHHLCHESKVGAIIDAASLPLDASVVHLCGRRALDPLALALHGGEDFELLFTVAPENVSRLPKRVDGVSISHIGEITSAAGIIRIRERNREWDLRPEGFEHFKR